MFKMIYIYTCQWCFKTHSAIYSGETICQQCDSELIDLEHSIYECPESLFLVNIRYTKKDIKKIIEKDVTYEQAVKTLMCKCDDLN